MSNDFSHLIIRQAEDICWVQINRPEDRNSLNSELITELIRLIEMTEVSNTRAIVFRGVGETYFIGGADGVEMHLFSSSEARTFSIHIQNLFNRMEASSLLMFAAINGLCFGGGYEFALACDFRIASNRARIGLPEVKVGIIPGGGGTQRLPRLVGMGKALEMILSGHLYSGEEALKIGLIHYLVEDQELEKKAGEILRKIFVFPRYAIASAKKAVRASQYFPFDQGLKIEAEEFGKCFAYDFFNHLIKEQLKDGRLKTSIQSK